MLWLKKMDSCNLLWATRATSNSNVMKTRGNEKYFRFDLCIVDGIGVINSIKSI